MAMPEPFEPVVKRHGATVLRICRATLGPGADAEDAWSETFLAALRAWPDLAPETNVEAWLVRVAGRKAIDQIRSRGRQPVPAATLPEPAGPDVDREGDGEVWRLVAKLPERQRLAVAYHYLGGLPHRETADLIGGSAEAVRRAAADGIKSLRRTYGVELSAENPVKGNGR